MNPEAMNTGAYADARYSDQFEFSVRTLTSLTDAAHRLRELVKAACEDRLAQLRRDMGPDPASRAAGSPQTIGPYDRRP